MKFLFLSFIILYSINSFSQVTISNNLSTVPKGKKWIIPINQELLVNVKYDALRAGNICNNLLNKSNQNSRYISSIVELGDEDAFRPKNQYVIVFNQIYSAPFGGNTLYYFKSTGYQQIVKDYRMTSYNNIVEIPKNLVFYSGQHLYVKDCINEIEVIELPLTQSDLKILESINKEKEKEKQIALEIEEKHREELKRKEAERYKIQSQLYDLKDLNNNEYIMCYNNIIKHLITYYENEQNILVLPSYSDIMKSQIKKYSSENNYQFELNRDFNKYRTTININLLKGNDENYEDLKKAIPNNLQLIKEHKKNNYNINVYAKYDIDILLHKGYTEITKKNNKIIYKNHMPLEIVQNEINQNFSNKKNGRYYIYYTYININEENSFQYKYEYNKSIGKKILTGFGTFLIILILVI